MQKKKTKKREAWINKQEKVLVKKPVLVEEKNRTCGGIRVVRNWWVQPSLFKKVSFSPAWCDHLGGFQQACSHTSLTHDRQSRPSFKPAAGPNMAISLPSAAVYQCHSGSTMQNLSLCFPPSLTLLLSLTSPSLHYCQGQEFLTPDSTPSSWVIYLFSRSHRSIWVFFSGALSG